MEKRCYRCRVERGITLVETLVAVTILVVLLMVAVPAYKSTIEGNRRATYANQLLEDLTLARSEAIKRNRQVVVCPSSTGTDCAAGTSNDWTSGWMIYVPTAGSGGFTGGDTILRAHPPLILPPGWAAVDNISVGTHFASFRPTGMVQTNFRICIMPSSIACSDAGVASATTYSNLVVSSIGRLRLESQ